MTKATATPVSERATPVAAPVAAPGTARRPAPARPRHQRGLPVRRDPAHVADIVATGFHDAHAHHPAFGVGRIRRSPHALDRVNRAPAIERRPQANAPERPAPAVNVGKIRRSPLVVRRLPTAKAWKSDSSRWNTRGRGPELQAIDTALEDYHRQLAAGITNQQKVTLLSRLQDLVNAYKQSKEDATTGEISSKRLSSIQALEDQIEADRIAAEQAIAAGIVEAPIDTDFTAMSVYQMSNLVDTSGVVGKSKEAFDAKKAELETAGQPASDVDVRVAMLKDKVKEASDHMAAERARTDSAATDPAAAKPKVIGLFTAPEWFFMRPNMPYTPADKEQIVNAVRTISSSAHNLLIVPGTILWGSGRGDQATLNNTAIAVMNGTLVHETNKHGEGMDIDPYINTMSGQALPTEARRAKKAERAAQWKRGGGAIEGHGDAGPDDTRFEVGNLVLTLEVCADHGSARAAREMAAANIAPADRAHVQILVSAGASLMGDSSNSMRPGGIAVQNDARVNAAAKDGTQAMGVRKVREGSTLPKDEKSLLKSEAELAQIFMGTYQLPK